MKWDIKYPRYEYYDDWYKWYAWRPVKTHAYFTLGHEPSGRPDQWVWFEKVWRMNTAGWGADSSSYVRIK